MLESMNRIKSLQPDRLDMDDAIALSATAALLKQEYTNRDVVVPVWLEEAIRVIVRWIADHSRDAKMAQLSRLRSRREMLLSRNEQKRQVDDEITRLEQELAQ